MENILEKLSSLNFDFKLPEANYQTLATTAAIGGAAVGISLLIQQSIRYSRAPPGPRRIPFLGNNEFSIGAFNNDDLQKLCKKYGPIMCLYIGSQPVVIISDYTILREAFVTKGVDLAGRPDSTLIKIYNPGYPDIKGILDAHYSEEWKGQRNTALMILRSLGWGQKSIQNKIQTESEAVIEELGKMNGAAFDPSTLIGTGVANIICALLFGQRFQYDDSEFMELLSSVDGLMDIFGSDLGEKYFFHLKLTSSHRQFEKRAYEVGGKLVAFYRKKIKEAKEKLESGEEATDFVSCYLKELEKIDKVDTKIKEDWTIQHVSDFFLAGSDTSATTLKWIFLYMANNQEVQEKVHKEISSKIKKDQDITLQDRENLPYTEATIMEVQRISAPVPFGAPHEALVNTTLGAYNIPKGTEIWGNIYGVMKDPNTFPDPHKLKPERFLTETLDSVKRIDQWIPFSLGRRTCLGEQLARQELFLFFTNIIRVFKILPPEGVEQVEFKELFKFVLKPSPYKVRFVKREKQCKKMGF